MKTPSIVAWMMVAIAGVTALAYWDEQRESQAALDDFAREQAALAEAVGASLGEKLATTARERALAAPPAELLAAVRAVEQKNLVRVLVGRPGATELVGSDGSSVAAHGIEKAMDENRAFYRLSRPEAAALGLPARTAMAGLHRVGNEALGRWSVAVVATAMAERDRQVRAEWRLLLGVVVASGLVIAFGGYAMRRQRKELELAHALALARIRNERDERLVRADKLATMGALATGVAHEVSTPLNVILARAEQLLPKQGDERNRRAVEIILEQSERISAVVRGFLALARGGQPALSRCDPAALARAAADLVEHRFDQARLRLDLDFAPDLPRVACDPRLFEQVLVNLLLNACDACADAGTRVALSVGASAEHVAFVVSDDGVGIPADVAERAAEPFFTTKPAGKGTGLGLAIATEIVKHHRGSLTLDGGPGGRGTQVRVELPVAISEEHA